MPSPDAFRQVLELLAYEGPLRARRWEAYAARWPAAWQTELQDAMAILGGRGDLLRGRERGAGDCYGVRPARLVKLSATGGTLGYCVLGHPAAEGPLRDWGELRGPDEQGVRVWYPRVPITHLYEDLIALGIQIDEEG